MLELLLNGLQMKSGAARHPITAFPAEASHLEMVQIAPRLQRLDVLLQVSQSCAKQMFVGDKCDFAGNDMISALHTFPPLVPVYSQSCQEILFASAMRLQSHRHTQAVDSMTGTGKFGI